MEATPSQPERRFRSARRFLRDLARLRRRASASAAVLIATLFLVPVATAEAPASPTTGTKPLLVCGAGSTLASGRPDRSLFSAAASKGIRAHWCERYDAQGRTTRTGPYWEVYPNGRPRTQALYVGSRLSGPVTIRNDDGSLFLRGFLEKGEWSGELEIYHENGEVWLEARFDAGRLDGPVRTHYPDGALESESRYQNGREDGLARSFYSTALGGRLKSEAHLEADDFVGRHRILSRRGELVRSIDWSAGPAAWRARAADTVPAAPRPGPASAQRPRPSVSPPSDTRD